MATCIDNAMRYERFLRVLSTEETARLCTDTPTLAQLQDWNERLTKHAEEIDTIFARAYNKQRKGRSK